MQAVLVPLFKADTSWREDETYTVINDMFLAAEAYDRETPDGLSRYSSTADELRAAAVRAASHLNPIVNEP
jgi:hypothetical protein